MPGHVHDQQVASTVNEPHTCVDEQFAGAPSRMLIDDCWSRRLKFRLSGRPSVTPELQATHSPCVHASDSIQILLSRVYALHILSSPLAGLQHPLISACLPYHPPLSLHATCHSHETPRK